MCLLATQAARLLDSQNSMYLVAIVIIVLATSYVSVKIGCHVVETYFISFSGHCVAKYNDIYSSKSHQVYTTDFVDLN